MPRSFSRPHRGNSFLGVFLVRGGSYMFVYNCFADGEKGRPRQLEMLDAERNADNGQNAKQPGKHMKTRKPPSGKNEPYDIADHPQNAGAEITSRGQVFAVDNFSPKREK